MSQMMVPGRIPITGLPGNQTTLITLLLALGVYSLPPCSSNWLVGSTHPGRSVTGLPAAPGKLALPPPLASPFKRTSRLE